MGFRPAPRIGMVPVGLKDGSLFFEDNIIPPIKVSDRLKAQNMDLQLNTVIDPMVRAYLRNDKISLIIREDGTYGVFTSNYAFLVMSELDNKLKLPSLEDYAGRIMYGGVMSQSDNLLIGAGGIAYLMKMLNNKWCLFAENIMLVAVNIPIDSYYFIYKRSVKIEMSPAITYIESTKSLRCMASGKEFYVECDQIIGDQEPISLKVGGRWV